VLLVVVLYQSMQISTLQSKVRQIAQAVAIQPHLEHPVPQKQQQHQHAEVFAEVAATSEDASHS
ncbi:MAG: DUF2304 domain-containing protein, partial [Tumebacillaceae bacterium]